MKFVMNIGLMALFLHCIRFKCHNRDCYQNRDMLGLRIVIGKNFHNRSGLVTYNYSGTRILVDPCYVDD